MNASEIDPYFMRTWLIASSIFIPFGVSENILSVLVLIRPRFSDMPSRYTLIALSINDGLVLFFGMFRYWLVAVFEYNPMNYSLWSCKVLSYLVITLSHISSGLVALVCVERFFAIVYYYILLPSKTIQIRGLYIVYFSSLFVNLHVIFNTILKENETNSTDFSCTSLNWNTAMAVDIIDSILLCFCPLFVILFSNGCIIVKLRKVSNQMQQNTRPNKVSMSSPLKQKRLLSITMNDNSSQITCHCSNVVSKKYQSYHRKRWKPWKRDTQVTIMLLFVSFVFLFCNFPFGVVHLLRTYVNGENTPTRPWDMAWISTYLLVYFNNCINFPIYIISQSVFRNHVISLLSCKKINKRL